MHQAGALRDIRHCDIIKHWILSSECKMYVSCVVPINMDTTQHFMLWFLPLALPPHVLGDYTSRSRGCACRKK